MSTTTGTSAPAKDGASGTTSCWDMLTKSDTNSSLRYLRMANMCNATFIMIVGVLTLINITNLIHPAYVAVALYLVIFGGVLCCFELRVKFVEEKVRRNFGFMYTFVGRTVFLLFLASFCFGVGSKELSTSCGVVTAINAVFNCFIIWKHGKMYEDPTDEYSTAAEMGAQYAQSNPELAQQAIRGGLNYAGDNPSVMRAGVNAGRAYAQEHPDQAMQFAQSTLAQQQQQSPNENPFHVSMV